jgi:hypothetical protein
LEQPVGRIIQLRLYPMRPPWSLGAGWAALGGGLAAAGLALTPETLLRLALVWLLADPILGVVWDLGAGPPGASARGLWRRLRDARPPETFAPVRLLPYLQPGSPGDRLAWRLGRLRSVWRTRLWPEAGQEMAALATALVLALLLGLALGRGVLALVLASLALSWPAARAAPSGDSSRAALWRALGEFGVPWLIGVLALGRLAWPLAWLGACYTIAYFGFIHPSAGFRFIGAGQAAAALLLAALRYPLAAAAAAVLLLPQWGLFAWASALDEAQPASLAAGRRRWPGYVQVFVIPAMLLAAVAVAS